MWRLRSKAAYKRMYVRVHMQQKLIIAPINTLALFFKNNCRYWSQLKRMFVKPQGEIILIYACNHLIKHIPIDQKLL